MVKGEVVVPQAGVTVGVMCVSKLPLNSKLARWATASVPLGGRRGVSRGGARGRRGKGRKRDGRRRGGGRV